MLVPATAVAGPLLVIWTSAEGASVTVLVAVLLVASPSRAPAGAVTVAVLTSRPVAFAAIRPVTTTVARSSASRVTVVARLPVPAGAAQLDPVSAVQVHVGATSATGKRSLTPAAVTGLGPRLVTTIVYDVASPGIAAPVKVLVTARSAIVSVVSNTVDVLSVRSGSG